MKATKISREEKAGRQAYLDAKAGKGLSPIFETLEEGKLWIAARRGLTPHSSRLPAP